MKFIKNLLIITVFLLLISGCSFPTATTSGSTATKMQQKPIVESNLKIENGKLNIIFLDVSQGASQLLVGPTGKTMLIDGGDNDKEELMLEYLRSYGVEKIDILIATHPDADHIGGLDAVVSNVDVGKIYMPKVTKNTKTFESLLTAIKEKGLKITTAKAGVKLDWEPGIEIDMLAPVKDKYEDTNNYSVVLKLKYKDRSALLTGDAEFISENDMMDSGKDLSADLLMVSHHGSAGSTSSKFLKAVQPEFAVIQVGENNYGHPTSKTLQRLKDQDVHIYRNDLNGTVFASTDGQKWSVSVEK
ncbi:ComEC/Rec2 family competence protein [Paenibacillus glucanolyticus]|jgi:beta-lactamase superfamily II metal-dependent hydrolase|uniref:Competence protein n=1 Tax=Paenibacillus glucanolyticus TaxID=59843 RepID=A0A163GSL8_9BACL|nr:ComEC/Rec2 family competence protein [Paenibacillus glucanolyticus]KZS45128.1 competence protein [Paenibacillus glucanolyticus]OMF65147.1 MBL fold metallo-hydrolase [Paenibacillus glucanolyticus]